MSDRTPTLEESLAQLPNGEELLAAYRESVEECRGLRELRESLRQTLVEVSERMGIGHAALSKMERKADIYVGTLRKAVEAMGGRLDVLVRMPGRPPVRLVRLDGEDARTVRKRRPAGVVDEAAGE